MPPPLAGMHASTCGRLRRDEFCWPIPCMHVTGQLQCGCSLLLLPPAACSCQAATVAELAQHAPGNMSILINALNRADLNQVIADPNFSGTIFAPTNKVRH